MKNIFIAGFAAISMLIVSCASGQANIKQPIVAQQLDLSNHYDSVAIITAEFSGRPMVAGTAFAIDKDHLLSAAHVCISALQIQIFMSRQKSLVLKQYDDRGNVKTTYGTEVEGISHTDDICILKRVDHGLRPVRISNNYKDVRTRDLVTIIGAPQGVVIGEFSGRVANPRLISPDAMLSQRLVVTAPATGGISGSPVFDKNGLVIGILVAGHETFDHLSICINGDAILKFLNEVGHRR